MGKKLGYETTFSFKRSDYGMSYGVDDNALGDEVTVILSVEAIAESMRSVPDIRSLRSRRSSSGGRRPPARRPSGSSAPPCSRSRWRGCASISRPAIRPRRASARGTRQLSKRGR